MLTSLFQVETEVPVVLSLKLMPARTVTRPPAYKSIMPLHACEGFLIDFGLGVFFREYQPFPHSS